MANHVIHRGTDGLGVGRIPAAGVIQGGGNGPCLLYTSDAADERSSVDLGGRRIIKKKKTVDHGAWRGLYSHT